MAGSKKKVKQTKDPGENRIREKCDPNQYYSCHPSWNFSICDKEQWSLFSEAQRAIFWDEILPHFQNLETQTWKEILINARKQNHSINITGLNKAASDRLTELYIEAESLISLRLTSTHRIYGYMTGAVFNILWVDLNHGDNESCVCRAHKKHS